MRATGGRAENTGAWTDPVTIVELLFSMLLTGFGSFGLARHLRDLRRAWSSYSWPKGEAVVVAAAVHERRGSRGRTVFEPTVEFRYTFRGIDYRGHRLAFGDVASGSRADAEKLAARFAVGTHWEVSIFERRPELAVLHPGPTGPSWFGVTFFAVYTGLAIVFLIEVVGRLRQ